MEIINPLKVMTLTSRNFNLLMERLALQVSRKATYISADVVVGCFKCPMSKVRGVVVFWISQGDVVFPNHRTFLLILQCCLNPETSEK